MAAGCTSTTAPVNQQPAPATGGTPSAGIANPASVNCKDKGGTLVIKPDPNGGQYGLCYFEDNRACEEWALFRGDCPVGGVKTTGYDTDAQSFCAWSGGSTLAVPNAVCTFKDGSTCLADAFYNGTCSRGENTTSTWQVKARSEGGYRIEKATTQSCTQDTDCVTPAEYLVQNRCPFTSLCLMNKCSIVCPKGF